MGLSNCGTRLWSSSGQTKEERENRGEEATAAGREILAWVSTCRGQASHFLFGSVVLASEKGFHWQPYPIALSSNALSSTSTTASLPELRLKKWYLDGGTVIKQVDQLRQAVELLERERSHLLDHGNIGGQDDPLCKGLVRVAEDGVILLGAPYWAALTLWQGY